MVTEQILVGKTFAGLKRTMAVTALCALLPVFADLSKMTLQVNDITKLGKNKKYKIATFQGGLANGEPFQSTNLPPGWGTRYYADSHELKIVPLNGTTLIVR